MAIVGTPGEQIQKAITAHGIWKVRLGQTVESGAGDMTVAVARADNQCPLGQWLYGPIDPALKASEHYATVKDMHARFHQAAADVLALSLARKKTEALSAMEFGSTFKQMSGKLVIALTAMSESVK